jgi:OOP family OmpA-OmpF porin
MIKRSLRQSCLFACFAIVAGFLSAAPSSLSAERPPRRQVTQHVNLQDTGQTVALSVGQQLIVTLPMKTYNDNYWYIARNSGDGLRLIAGPDERRPKNWQPSRRYTSQVFYFRKETPGTAHLVLEQSYWSKPMILKVVDRPFPSALLPPAYPPSSAPLAAASSTPPVRERVVLRGIHFDFDESRIRPGDAAVLDEDASTLKASPKMAVNVNGYCDAIGGEEYNLKLSVRRADAVVDYLVKSGIPSSQLIPYGYGKTDFVATNDTAEGRAQNRRVELVPNQ